jgi:hypothetical protein
MYGENSGDLRHALGVLAREHRIQQRLGGKGTHTLPETTTVEERGELGKQIRRYRQCVLTWCLQAVDVANPRINLDEDTTGRSRGPAEQLRYRLTEALSAVSAELAHGDELVIEQPFATVETWRHAARAAVLGEHDLSGGAGLAWLSEQQRMTVLKDAADIVRSLVALDRRYEGVPGWEKLHNHGRLGSAAEACAAHAGYGEPDYTVDRLGWHPTPQPMDGTTVPGLAGVMQAQYNLLLHLHEIPDARSLRVVMDSQRVVTHEAVTRIGDVEPELAEKWTTRKQTYSKLVKKTRDLGGVLGKPHAASQGAIAAGRAEKLGREPLTDSKQLRQLDRLFSHIDERVVAAVEHGVQERLYFLRVPFPRVDDHSPGMVKGPRHRFVPITSPVQTDLLSIVRHELRPAPITPTPPRGAAQSRLDFEAALRHRPGDPRPPLAL